MTIEILINAAFILVAFSFGEWKGNRDWEKNADRNGPLVHKKHLYKVVRIGDSDLFKNDEKEEENNGNTPRNRYH